MSRKQPIGAWPALYPSRRVVMRNLRSLASFEVSWNYRARLKFVRQFIAGRCRIDQSVSWTIVRQALLCADHCSDLLYPASLRFSSQMLENAVCSASCKASESFAILYHDDVVLALREKLLSVIFLRLRHYGVRLSKRDKSLGGPPILNQAAPGCFTVPNAASREKKKIKNRYQTAPHRKKQIDNSM